MREPTPKCGLSFCPHCYPKDACLDCGKKESAHKAGDWDCSGFRSSARPAPTKDLIPESNAGVREAIATLGSDVRKVARKIVSDVGLGVCDDDIFELNRIAEAAESALSLLPASIDVVGKAREALERIRGEIGPAKRYAESYGLEGGKLPSAVHIKLDMIDGYARTALASLTGEKL